MDKIDAHVHQLIDSGERPTRNLVRRPMADLLTFVLVLFAFVLKVVSILRYVHVNKIRTSKTETNSSLSLSLSLPFLLSLSLSLSLPPPPLHRSELRKDWELPLPLCYLLFSCTICSITSDQSLYCIQFLSSSHGGNFVDLAI